MALRHAYKMKITKRFINSLDPCFTLHEFWLKSKKPDLADFMLHALNENHFKWAIWLFVRSVDKITNVKLALFSAEQVLHIFEKAYPKDNRPRLAIQATKDYIANPCKETADAVAYTTRAVASSAEVAHADAVASDYSPDSTAVYATSAVAYDPIYDPTYDPTTVYGALYAAVVAVHYDTTVAPTIIDYTIYLLKEKPL